MDPIRILLLLRDVPPCRLPHRSARARSTPGSSINEELRDGSSPLHYLCNRANYAGYIKGLVASEAEWCFDGTTGDGAEQCLQILLSAASASGLALLDGKDNYGNTPLHLACKNVVKPGLLVDSLLKAGASVHAVDPNGKTPLHLALKTACDDAPAAVQLLLDAGSDVLFKDEEGKTPLDVAMRLRDQSDFKARGEALATLLREPTERAKAALAESRRAEKMLKAAKRREQQAKQTEAAAAEHERRARDSARALAAQQARRAAEAAAIEEQRRALASETEAKLAAERAAAEASLVLVREKAALARAAERAESRRALAARKAAAEEDARRA